ncbi:MAG: rRNA cytosine-C5-methyltransferase [Bacteroidales bacterium]|nr:rRNA cytosine-C5-methyltransferase [Bacteroidales bacterium]
MLPDGFIASLVESVGRAAADRFESAVLCAPSVSVRLNPFKTPSVPDPILDGAACVPWNSDGRILSQRPLFTLEPLFHAGAYYVQDSSAMFPGWVARRMLDGLAPADGRPVRVLDLCAAPGGKTTDLAASLRTRFGDGFLLVANEVMRSRAAVLSDNVAVWGDPNVTVTSVDPKAFAAFEGFFDLIVADVPCSGEGMFRKEEKAVADWSPQTVDLCAARQKRILSDVWPALREGGVLVYSTCTFSRAENDDNLAWMKASFGVEPCTPSDPFEGVLDTAFGRLLVPGSVPGEGQYAAAVRRLAGPAASRKPVSEVQRLRPLRSGVRKGVWKGRDFVPDPDWALSLSYGRGEWPEWEVDRETALRFLHKDALVLPDAPRGVVLLTYASLPLGFVKNIGSRCNNLHPAGRRIMMDINTGL